MSLENIEFLSLIFLFIKEMALILTIEMMASSIIILCEVILFIGKRITNSIFRLNTVSVWELSLPIRWKTVLGSNNLFRLNYRIGFPRITNCLGVFECIDIISFSKDDGIINWTILFFLFLYHGIIVLIVHWIAYSLLFLNVVFIILILSWIIIPVLTLAINCIFWVKLLLSFILVNILSIRLLIKFFFLFWIFFI